MRVSTFAAFWWQDSCTRTGARLLLQVPTAPLARRSSSATPSDDYLIEMIAAGVKRFFREKATPHHRVMLDETSSV